MTSLMIKETQPIFLAEREKKNEDRGNNALSGPVWIESPVSQHLRISEELLVIAGVGGSSGSLQASFNTTWLGGLEADAATHLHQGRRN